MRPAGPCRESPAGQMLPAAAVAIFTGIIGFAALHAPPQAGEMGVVFPPWVSQAEAVGAIVAAGGRIVDTSRLNNVVIAYGLDETFQEKVRDHGAWFTVAAIGLCAGTGGLGG
jgi:hypothetical protein